MKSWRLAIPALLALAASGCTPGQHHVEVTALQNENRDLEDNLYQQQAALKDLCQQLDACRKDNKALRDRLQKLSPGCSEIAPKQPAAPAAEPPKSPSVDLGQPMPSSQMPELLHTPDSPGGLPQAPEAETQRTTDAPLSPFPPPSAGPPPHVPPPAPAPKPLPGDSTPSASLKAVSPAPQFGHAVEGDNTKVAAITLHPLAAGGRRADQPPGGDGIALWVEPRDQAGNPVRAAAPVAVVVLDPDPSMVGQAARVARWDFASEATAAFYRKTAAAEGIFLELTWPGDPPKHRTLEVFVRYTTDDGRKLEARRTVHIDLANHPGEEPHAGWSRRAAPVPVATAAYPTGESPSATPRESSAASDASPSQRPKRVVPAGGESAEKPKLESPTWSPDRP